MRDCASSLGLAGWVRNLPDGRVEAIFEGERTVLLKALDFCKTGPPASNVDGTDVEWEPPEGIVGFSVR